MAMVSTVIIIYTVAILAIAQGIVDMSTGFKERKGERTEWGLFFSGLFMLLLGALFLIFPLFGGFTVMVSIGVLSIVLGGIITFYSFRVRKVVLSLDREKKKATQK